LTISVSWLPSQRSLTLGSRRWMGSTRVIFMGACRGLSRRLRLRGRLLRRKRRRLFLHPVQRDYRLFTVVDVDDRLVFRAKMVVVLAVGHQQHELAVMLDRRMDLRHEGIFFGLWRIGHVERFGSSLQVRPVTQRQEKAGAAERQDVIHAVQRRNGLT